MKEGVTKQEQFLLDNKESLVEKFKESLNKFNKMLNLST
jgi:hypothetical protein